MTEHPKSTAKIAAKLVLAAKAIGFTIEQDDKVAFGNTRYSFTSAEFTKSRVGPALANEGVAVTAHFSVLHSSLVETKKGFERYVEVIATLRFTDSESGEFLDTDGLGSNQDGRDKALMGAATAASRDAYFIAFNIGRGIDPETSNRPVDKTNGKGDRREGRPQHREEKASLPPSPDAVCSWYEKAETREHISKTDQAWNRHEQSYLDGHVGAMYAARLHALSRMKGGN